MQEGIRNLQLWAQLKIVFKTAFGHFKGVTLHLHIISGFFTDCTQASPLVRPRVADIITSSVVKARPRFMTRPLLQMGLILKIAILDSIKSASKPHTTLTRGYEKYNWTRRKYRFFSLPHCGKERPLSGPYAWQIFFGV